MAKPEKTRYNLAVETLIGKFCLSTKFEQLRYNLTVETLIGGFAYGKA